MPLLIHSAHQRDIQGTTFSREPSTGRRAEIEIKRRYNYLASHQKEHCGKARITSASLVANLCLGLQCSHPPQILGQLAVQVRGGAPVDLELLQAQCQPGFCGVDL